MAASLIFEKEESDVKYLSTNHGLTGAKYRNTEPVLDATKHVERAIELQNNATDACTRGLCLLRKAVANVMKEVT